MGLLRSPFYEQIKKKEQCCGFVWVIIRIVGVLKF